MCNMLSFHRLPMQFPMCFESIVANASEAFFTRTQKVDYCFNTVWLTTTINYVQKSQASKQSSSSRTPNWKPLHVGCGQSGVETSREDRHGTPLLGIEISRPNDEKTPKSWGSIFWEALLDWDFPVRLSIGRSCLYSQVSTLPYFFLSMM